jgi:hypothetical protein
MFNAPFSFNYVQFVKKVKSGQGAGTGYTVFGVRPDILAIIAQGNWASPVRDSGDDNSFPGAANEFIGYLELVWLAVSNWARVRMLETLHSRASKP